MNTYNATATHGRRIPYIAGQVTATQRFLLRSPLAHVTVWSPGTCSGEEDSNGGGMAKKTGRCRKLIDRTSTYGTKDYGVMKVLSYKPLAAGFDE